MLVLALIAACGLLLAEWRRRQALYWYDVATDYRFSFSETGLQRIGVRVTPEGFTFPHSASHWDAAFLSLTVAASATGSWFEPGVEVSVAGGSGCRQHFERRASGRRYLNLCAGSTALTGGTHVGLRGLHLGWREQEAELLLFSNALPEAARLLVLAPHADDAEIAAFGLYAHRDSWVATITNGSYGGATYRDLVLNAAERDALQADLRLWDSLASTTWAGLTVDRAINLGYFTLTLEAMYHRPRQPIANPVTGSKDIAPWRRASLAAVAARRAVPTWESLVGDLEALLTDLQPQIVVAPHPALDGNRDHVFTTVALLEALEHAGNPALDLLLYTNHHVQTEYYPFGPADAAVTLPHPGDAALPVSAIVSLPLAPERQLAKLFALDAMHDLRPAPRPVVGGVGTRVLGRIGQAVADIARDPALEYSYFRRAARPNELFFRYATEDRQMLFHLIPPRGAVPHGG
jgi:LmbE family N-acetylglucosaminyl deacetylase